MTTPFFIVGASRSGTTLLRLMLNAHSRLGIPGELKYFQTIDRTPDLRSWRREWPEDAYRALVRAYLENRSTLFPDDTDTLAKLILADGERTLRGPYRVLLEHWAGQSGKARWGEKTPHNLFFVDVLSDMFPRAKFIHVVRDPRAVVHSMNTSPYYSAETVFNALNWRKSIQVGEKACRQWLTPEQQLTIRYEDLVGTPEATLASICRFLDEPFESGMLRFYESAEESMPQPIRTPSIRRPVHQKSLTKWKESFSPADVAVVEAICATEMKQLGYERQTGSPFLTYAWASAKVAYWHWKVWRHRRQRGYEVGYTFLAGLQSRAKRLPALSSLF